MNLKKVQVLLPEHNFDANVKFSAFLLQDIVITIKDFNFFKVLQQIKFFFLKIIHYFLISGIPVPEKSNFGNREKSGTGNSREFPFPFPKLASLAAHCNIIEFNKTFIQTSTFFPPPRQPIFSNSDDSHNLLAFYSIAMLTNYCCCCCCFIQK